MARKHAISPRDCGDFLVTLFSEYGRYPLHPGRPFFPGKRRLSSSCLTSGEPLVVSISLSRLWWSRINVLLLSGIFTIQKYFPAVLSSWATVVLLSPACDQHSALQILRPALRNDHPALYYPSSAEKIGQFSLPAVRMPYRALGSNLLRRFMQRTAFLPKW